jgi:tetratricopeptide (TPR) repeat protein
MVWQVPALLTATGLLVAGMAYAFSTAPKPDLSADFTLAQRQLAAASYGEALETLNARILPHFGGPALSPDQRREFHVLRARALYLGQKDLGIDRAENHRSIQGEYAAAQRLNATLTPLDREYLASTLVSLGELPQAVELVRQLTPEQREPREALLRRMIEATSAGPSANPSLALDLLAMLGADSGLSFETRIWALSRQVGVLVQQGYPEEAISKALRALPRLSGDGVPEGAAGAALGELFLQLGRAYLVTDETGEARKQLERAEAILGEENVKTAEAILLQAGLDRRAGDLTRARERLTDLLARYPFAEIVPQATLQAAEVEAALAVAQGAGTLEESFARYEHLVDLLTSGDPVPGLTREELGKSLVSRFREQYDRGDDASALKFADLAGRIYDADSEPPELAEGLGRTHLRVAGDLLAAAGEGGALSLADLDPATQREARGHLVRAGESFRAHAAKVVTTDAKLYGDSLWAAADAFDRAGDLDDSISAFQQFVTDFPTDTRLAETQFRLAQAYKARGDLPLAVGLYRALIAGRDGSAAAGPFADASYVPLAEALLLDADDANDAEAEQLLNTVVSGELVGTQTAAFRQALRELGRFYYQHGQPERAIERLEEFLARTQEAEALGDEPQTREPGVPGRERERAEVTFMLADSYRLSASRIAAALREALPDEERRVLDRTRRDRLTRSGELFSAVRETLDGFRRRSALEELYLRNAYLYSGDTAFDLGEFDRAIRAYDAARDRFPQDPASLVALVQIVNALVAQGEIDKARTAHARARRFFQSLPESVWDDPALPMTRREWERWLDAQDRLGLITPRGSSTTDASPRGGS